MARPDPRVRLVLAAVLAFGPIAQAATAGYTVHLLRPNPDAGSTYALNATVQYSGDFSWTDGTPASLYSFELDIVYGANTPYNNANNHGSNTGISDTAYANISSTDNINKMITFTSAQVQLPSGQILQAQPLTALQVNTYRYYYFVVVYPLFKGNYFGQGGSIVSAGTSWFYIQ